MGAGDTFGAGNGLTDQLFNRDDGFLVERGNDGDRGAGASGAAGAADAMDIIVGMMGHVEIEDVAEVGNVEAAGGDVGSDQQRNFALAELIERRSACRLIHVAMQGADAEAMLLQRFVQQRHFALAVAEDDGVLEVLGVAEQAAQRFALLMRLAADADQELGDAGGRGRGARNFDPFGIVQEVSVMRRISGGIVAEKNSVCRVNGTSLQMRSMSGMKPMSSMRSASSMTSSSTPVSSSPPRSEWSSSRPGVAIRTSTPRVSFVSWSPNETPPISSATLSFWPAPYLSKLSLHLGGEFAGRLEDQGAGHARPGAALFQHREHRKDEGGGLAGAGLGDAENVPAGQNMGNGLFLNGGGGGVAGGRDGGEHLVGQAEMGKRH